ncbi:MAG: chromosomal replication initiator protein DnaA [Erysipelotrichaceae bacterium]|nr:chromosomal replication initiator protein DnaA [Erysipelotrichaceae bacterium]
MVVPVFINYSIMSDNLKTIEDCLEEVLGRRMKVRITQQNDNAPVVSIQGAVKNDFLSREIDPNQTFTNFITGRSNVQAHLAATTVALNPGIIYNPLFIYGNSGLGKTHLLNAIGNKVKESFPNKRIGFTSGPEFVEGVFKASKENRFDDFKNVFNSLDILLVDDIQFLANKPKTHELFFTVFNELVNNHKQICLTSDRSPGEIKGLEDRIISRFNQGLNVNIEAPEYETSINILKMKISNSTLSNQLTVDDEVLNYLATNFSQDVRSLEGAVNRLLFYSINFPLKEDRDHISLKLAVEAFKDQIKDSSNELAISSVRKAVCDYYNLTKQQITSANRTRNISNARQIAMYLCRKLLDATFDDIGREFGGRDHSTVMNACDNIEKKIKTDPVYLKVINEIESSIR